MSKYLISPIISHPDLTGIDIAVWHGLSSFAQWEFEDGTPVKSRVDTCFPSIKALVAMTKFSKSSICEALKKLEKLGYIQRLVRGRRGRSTKYTLICPISPTTNNKSNNVRHTDKCANGNCPSHEHSMSATRTEYVRHTDTNIPNNNIINIYQEKEKEKEKAKKIKNKLKNINQSINNSENSENRENNKQENITQEQENIENIENITVVQKIIARDEYFKRSRTPIKDAEYDKRALQVINDMYYLCLNYEPDVSAEIRLLQDLREEYPNINLFRAFRLARDWLEARDEAARPVNLIQFLRKWTAKASVQNVIQAHRGRY